uniref:Uncharacterized protein n=1 Tax=Oryza glumipatula TaxID=40148 RepID=A0A0E0B2D8_9ORYZ
MGASSSADVNRHLTLLTPATAPNRLHQPIGERSRRRNSLLHAAAAVSPFAFSSETAISNRPPPPINSRRDRPPLLTLSELEALPLSLLSSPADPNPCTTDFPSLRRTHFSRFPLLPHPIATTSFAAEEKLFYLPFRPTSPLSRPATDFPGCASLGNTLGRRHRSRSTIGAPAPLLSLSLLLHEKEKRRKMTGGRRRRKRKRKRKTDRKLNKN